MVELIEHAVRNGEGRLGPDGQIIVETGKHTGRSPKDKFFVREPGSENAHRLDARTNRSMPRQVRRAARRASRDFLAGKDIYALDCYVGADPRYRLPVRVVTEYAWQNLFARDLFIVRDRRRRRFQAGVHRRRRARCSKPIPERDGTRSETFILVNFARKIVLIGGTRYAGEIKKSVFTLMNYLMPLRGVLADALLGQRRSEERRRDLLRPLGHRQDDALGRSARAR